MLTHLSFRQRLLLRIIDALLVTFALILASKLRLVVELGEEGPDRAFSTPHILIPVAIVIWLISFQLSHVYSIPASHYLLIELKKTITGCILACLLFFGMLYVIYRDYSRLQAFYFVAMAFAATISHRLLVRIIYNLAGHRVNSHRIVVVIGTGMNAQRVGETTCLHNWTGLALLGYIKTGDEESAVPTKQIIGPINELPKIIEQNRIDEIIVATHSPDEIDLGALMQMVGNYPISVRVAPDYSTVAYFHVSVDNFAGIPLLGLREPVFTPSQLFIKRTFDTVIAALMLLLIWPLLAVIATAIRLDSPGPALLRQKRIGQYGRPFTMIKFRSMYVNAQPLPEGENPKPRSDPRVTRVGRFIRRTSLDELPQIFNVIKGDMSLVGPRPEMPWLVEKYEFWQRKRFEVPQGMTGWWQINGRAEKPMYLNTEDDLFYIRNYSFWLDLRILLRTVVTVIVGRGAF